MSQSDWTEFTGTTYATAADMLCKVTMCPSLAPIEGSFCMGFRSLASTAKFRGQISAKNYFDPLPANKGGSMRAYVRKDSPISAPGAFAPMLFFVDSASWDDDPKGYILGLTHSAPYQIAFKKGKLSTGLSAGGMLGEKMFVGSSHYNAAQWIGLRLDFIFNPQGDLVFNVYYDANCSPATPDWERAAGFPSALVDDNLGKVFLTNPATYPTPFTSQLYPGFGMYSEQADCITAFDCIRLRRQLTP